MSAAADAPGAARATATRVRLEPAGRLAAPLALLALLVGWAAGGVALLAAALGLAVLAVALWCALRHGSGVELRALSGGRHFLGDPFLFELEVRARRPRPSPQRDLWLSPDGRGARAGRPVAELVRLPGREAVVVRCGHRMLRRGPQRVLPLTLHSSYPFGLVRVERSYALPVDLLAWPRLGRWRPGRRAAPARSEAPRVIDPERRSDEEFHELREWREGLSLRHAHWKLSARRGRTILRELRGPSDEPARVGLLLAYVATALPGRSAAGGFETAVSLAATMVDVHLRRGRTVWLGLHGPGGVERLTLRGRAGRVAALDRLARVSAESVAPAELLARAQAALAERDERLVVAAGGRGALDELGGRAGARVIDVDAPDLDAVFLRLQGAQPSRLDEGVA